jgi:hypothetical protein
MHNDLFYKSVDDLEDAMYDNDTQKVSMIIKDNPDLLNYKDERGGRVPIIEASIGGKTEMIKTLLDLGANPNETDWDGESALQNFLDNVIFYDPTNDGPNRCEYISEEEYIEIIRIFLDYGANINHTGCGGNTILMGVCGERPNIKLIKFLLENGADPHIKNDSGETALNFAEEIFYDDKELIKNLENMFNNKKNIL